MAHQLNADAGMHRSLPKLRGHLSRKCDALPPKRRRTRAAGSHQPADCVRRDLRTSARFILLGSKHHVRTCEICAEVCDACAEACESLGDDEMMRQCAEVCRRCAESCREMAGTRLRA